MTQFELSRDAADILTTEEVARELRCSKAHVSKAIAGRLANVSPLPAIPMGRRKLVRRPALLQWLEENEARSGILAPSPETNAVSAS
jgi:excisionase family DNA binding protein